MIKLNNVSLDIYGAGNILNNINWHIKAGEKWILFGRNGSGKSKLLEIVTGYNFPSQGDVTRFGLGQPGYDIRELRKRIGYVSSSLWEMFNRSEGLIDAVLSGLYASIGMYREATKEEKERAAHLIGTIGLKGREYDTIGNLSDGEKQKLLILRSLISEPDMLIFDEPSAGLDIIARENLLEAIEELTDKKTISVIYVTHHVEEITPFFENIFIIDKGECFFKGTVEEVLDRDIFSSLFHKKIEVFRKEGRLYSMLNTCS